MIQKLYEIWCTNGDNEYPVHAVLSEQEWKNIFSRDVRSNNIDKLRKVCYAMNTFARYGDVYIIRESE